LLQEEDDGGGESGRAGGGGGAGLRSEARASQKEIGRRGPAALQLRRKAIGEGGGGGLVVVEDLLSRQGGGVQSIKGGGEGEGAGLPGRTKQKRLQKEESFRGRARQGINSGFKLRESIRCSCHYRASPPALTRRGGLVARLVLCWRWWQWHCKSSRRTTAKAGRKTTTRRRG